MSKYWELEFTLQVHLRGGHTITRQCYMRTYRDTVEAAQKAVPERLTALIEKGKRGEPGFATIHIPTRREDSTNLFQQQEGMLVLVPKNIVAFEIYF